MTANANFLTTMGYRLDEIAGRHHAIFMAPEERNGDCYRRFWDALRRGEHRTAEFRRLRKDGGDVWIQASYKPRLRRARPLGQGRQIGNAGQPGEVEEFEPYSTGSRTFPRHLTTLRFISCVDRAEYNGIILAVLEINPA
ncbi:PAS domain-containing protein [Azospirillum brasilense]|uniref:PAS domain-containing protein n=1 Tax=Azospirillum brasilense TaxID=192 RepID=UPI001EDC2F2C|nr:PAS domain-containing protein [Azospirillum brasilense]